MEKYRLLSGNSLKIIALISMFIDHIAAVVNVHCPWFSNNLLPRHELYVNIYSLMRGIGRLSFPIFCFLLVQGFMYTRNRAKYLMRLMLFAVISEIPFDLALKGQVIEFTHQNVFFTLMLGFTVLMIIEKFEQRPYVGFFAAAAGCLISYLLNFDYDWRGILLIVVLYYLRFYRKYQLICGALTICWGNMQEYAVPAFLLLYFYSGKPGKRLKYFYYIAYPAHLLLYYFAARYLLVSNPV